MLIVPLAAVPNQVLTIALSGQDCRIAVYQKTTGVYLDLYVRDVVILAGALCLDRVLVVRDKYLGFAGDLAFADTLGTDDPVSTGFGSRFLLCYIEPSELL